MPQESEMNCEKFTELIGIDPATADADTLAHEHECPGCAAYAKRARRAEALIHKALRFDTVKVVAQPPRRQAAYGSIAAAVVAGLAFWFGLAVDRPVPTEKLVADIFAHMDHEPYALELTRVSVAERDLNQVLAGQATIDLATLGARVGPITYANKCAVAGQWVSHLVVQSDNGPVTVLLIPEQSVNEIVPLELAEQGLGGRIVPAGRGAIAVLGEDDAGSENTARRVADAVRITI
jgi:hypothetical protein